MSAPYPIVAIEWIDSAGDDEVWVKPSKVERRAASTCHSVGYLVDRHEYALTLAQSLGMAEEGDGIEELGNILTIPVGCVVSMRTLSC